MLSSTSGNNNSNDQMARHRPLNSIRMRSQDHQCRHHLAEERHSSYKERRGHNSRKARHVVSREVVQVQDRT